jgi:hypothetical protein
MFRKAFRVALPSLLLALTLAPAAGAQSAAEVIETAMARFEDRVAGIDNYTVTMDAMGFEVTNYFEKELVDGRPTFVLKSHSGQGQEGAGLLYHGFMEVVDRVQLEGRESVDGYDCFVLAVDDLSGVDFYPKMSDDEDDFRPKHGTFYLDADDYLIRKLKMDGELLSESGWQEITMEIDFRDYREVDGMVHPFVFEMNVFGMQKAHSEEELQQLREQLEEMKRRMAEMPEDQRAAVEQMMGPRIREMERMLDSDVMQVTTQVTELKVNAGPPS